MDSGCGNTARHRRRFRLTTASHRVVGDLAVDELLHEVTFAESPVEVQIFGEKHGRDHAHAVVLIAGGIQLTHAGVDNREAGAALLPSIEGVVLVRIVPLEAAPLFVELVFENFGEVTEDGHEKFAPGELLLKGVQRFAGGRPIGIVGGLPGFLKNLAR